MTAKELVIAIMEAKAVREEVAGWRSLSTVVLSPKALGRIEGYMGVENLVSLAGMPVRTDPCLPYPFLVRRREPHEAS